MNNRPTELHSPILSRVLRSIALNRTPGFSFLNHLLGVPFDKSGDGQRVVFEQGPHNSDENNEIDFVSLGVFVDVAMGRCVRYALDDYSLLATASITLSLTGAPRRGQLVATSRFIGRLDAEGRPARAEIVIEGPNGETIGSASGLFMLATPKAPLIIYRPPEQLDPIGINDLNGDEMTLFRRAEWALDRSAKGEGAFPTNFWGVDTRRTETGSMTTIDNGQQIANRSGQLMGGVQLGIACRAGCAAFDDQWMLSGVTATYIRPGSTPEVTATSEFVHRGRTTCVIQTQIRDANGKLVLHALSTHAKRV